MATKRKTFQYKTTISVCRDSFLEKVVLNEDLSKKDLRVVIHLLTHLDSIIPKSISVKQIAKDLNLKKKDVEESIQNLIDHLIIDYTKTGTVEKGYLLLF